MVPTMALRRGLATAAMLMAACSFHGGGLGAGTGETDDGGGLIGTPFPKSDAATAEGTGGLGGIAGGAAGSGGAGGLTTDAAEPPAPDATMVLPPDAAIVPPAPDVAPLPPDAAPVPPDVAIAPPPPDAAPPPRDAAPPPPPRDGPSGTPNLVTCGYTSCNTLRESCCITQTGSSCIPAGSGCPGTVRRCDGPEDCTGSGQRVCCERPEAVGSFRSACTMLSECTLSGGSVICRSNADCTQGRSCVGVNVNGTIIGLCR